MTDDFGFILPRSGESTSAQLRRALGERDHAVRQALYIRADLARTQQALAASQADLTRVERERDTLRLAVAHGRTARTAIEHERDELATAVAGWVARFHAAHEALAIEDFDGDSCPDLETTIQYAINRYRNVCASEEQAAHQIDLLRAELASVRTELEHKRENARIRARVVRELTDERDQLRAELERLRPPTNQNEGAHG